eukprot:Sro14_g010510.2  (96) ;mRNA; f:69720-70007
MNSGDVKDKGSGNRRHSHRLGSHIATEEETDSGQGEEGGRRVTRGRRQILEDVRCVNRSRSKKLDTDRNTKNKSTKKRTNGHANEEESQTNKRAK